MTASEREALIARLEKAHGRGIGNPSDNADILAACAEMRRMSGTWSDARLVAELETDAYSLRLFVDEAPVSRTWREAAAERLTNAAAELSRLGAENERLDVVIMDALNVLSMPRCYGEHYDDHAAHTREKAERILKGTADDA